MPQELLNRINRDTNEELFPIELDYGILQPDPEALLEALEAHDRYDDPMEPFIASSSLVLFSDAI